MDSEDVTNFLLFTDTVDGNDKWIVMEYILENSNDEQWHFLYKKIEMHFKLNKSKRNNTLCSF